MANINVSSPSNFVHLYLSTATITDVTASGVLEVIGLQDVTVTNNNGVFRWKQLDQTGQLVAVTPATNSLNLTIVLDDAVFYGSGDVLAGGADSRSAAAQGLFNLSNDKERVYFAFEFGGGTTSTVSGSGFLSGLAPKVTPDQPVWISPLIVEVSGKYTTGLGGIGV